MVAELGMTEGAIEANLKPFLLVLCVSLSVATLPNIFGWFRRIPYTLLLVIVGLGLALVNVRLVNLSPGLILTIFLPPLLFEAAWNLKWSSLKQAFLPVSLFAIIGVIISIAGITLGLTQFAGLSLTTALLIGVCLSATDPVSVVALFRELGVEKQLLTLTEGESLFNDGMAVVAFSFILSFSLGTTEFALQPILLDFFTVVGVGVGIGALIGFAISYLTQRFDLPLVEQSLTLVSAYGAYLLAEDLGGSGVIAVVTTGLILGNFGSRIGMNPRTRVIVTEFWDFLAFFVNSIVFLLIGDQIHFESLEQNLPTIAITVFAMLLMRAISIFTLSLVSNRFSATPISLAEQTLLWWGGLRGSVSIALALSVPVALQERETVISTVFGTVLFTLLVQGLSVRPLLELFNLLGDQPLRQQFSEFVARQVALKRVEQYLEEIDHRPGIEPDFFGYQKALVRGELNRLGEEIDKLQDQNPSLREFATEQLRNELLAIEANTYAEFVQTGRLNQELASLLEEVIEE
jgi:CPA1 family monovalent cation:H+ antiporter